MLKYTNPKKREDIKDETIAAMKARGFDIYVYRNGKDLFINSDSWDEDKEDRLYNEYGLKTFREQSGDENLVVYDPKFFEVTENLWFGEENLSYCGPNSGEVEFPVNCSSMQGMFSPLFRGEVNFSECDLSNISCIDSAFEMSSVDKVIFGKQNLYKIKRFEKVFRDCTSLETVDFSGVLLPNVTGISQCFFRCRSLKNINIGKVRMPKLAVIDSCFEDCFELRSIECPNWDCTITHVYSAFDCCYSLQNVSMPNVVFNGGKNFNKMFRNATNFINFNFRDFKLDNTNVTDELVNESMFRGCTKLRDRFGCILAKEVLECFKAENSGYKELSILESFN